MNMCAEAKDAGIKSLVALDDQGEQLDKVRLGLTASTATWAWLRKHSSPWIWLLESSQSSGRSPRVSRRTKRFGVRSREEAVAVVSPPPVLRLERAPLLRGSLMTTGRRRWRTTCSR